MLYNKCLASVISHSYIRDHISTLWHTTSYFSLETNNIPSLCPDQCTEGLAQIWIIVEFFSQIWPSLKTTTTVVTPDFESRHQSTLCFPCKCGLYPCLPITRANEKLQLTLKIMGKSTTERITQVFILLSPSPYALTLSGKGHSILL